MPQVPMFQGGLPQVGAQVGGGMVVQAPRPSTDYARTMAVATKPLEDFAGNLQKMAEVGFARDVKAKSDEAEIAAMKVIDGALYGEDGYMTCRGEDATNAYEGSMKAIESGVLGIVGSLPGPVRDAVGSRLQERVMNARRTMMRWRAEQTREWHLRSSQSRVEAIIGDAGNHYADIEYYAKSFASAVDEVNYQASALGLPQEVRDEEIKKLSAAMQANRLTTWSQDDPVGAFNELQKVRGKIDAATYGKLDAGLWARVKPVLAYQLSKDAPYICKAQEAYKQPDFSEQYNTKLSPEEEKEFQKWAQENGREKDVYDYDLRGAWKELQNGEMSEDARGHLGDKYKKPNHPTFSSQSIYANGDGGTWSVDAAGHDVFTPGKKISAAQADYLREYFARVEPGAVLNLDGKVESSGGTRRQMLDPMKPTGIPEIDNLSVARRIELFSRVKMVSDRGRAEQSSELRRAVENSLALAGQDGVDPDPLNLADFVSVYGEQKGVYEFEEYSNNLAAREKIHSFSGLSNADIAATVDAMRPIRGSDTYADQLKLYQAAQKAAGVVLKGRQDDPVGAALTDPKYGLSPITSWTDPALGQKLSARAAAADQIAKDYGTTPALFSEAERADLLAKLQGKPPQEQSAMLVQIATAAGGAADPIDLSAQLGVDDGFGTAYLLAADPSMRKADLPRLYLLGRQGLKEKRPDLKMLSDTTVGTASYALELDGLYDGPEERRQILDAIGTVAAGITLETGEFPTSSLDKASKLVLGDVYDYNGRKVALKGDLNLGDVERVVRDRARSYEGSPNVVARLPNGSQITGAQLAQTLPTAPLMPADDGEDNHFNVVVGGQILLDMDGKPYVVEVFR